MQRFDLKTFIQSFIIQCEHWTAILFLCWTIFCQFYAFAILPHHYLILIFMTTINTTISLIIILIIILITTMFTKMADVATLSGVSNAGQLTTQQRTKGRKGKVSDMLPCQSSNTITNTKFAKSVRHFWNLDSQQHGLRTKGREGKFSESLANL